MKREWLDKLIKRITRKKDDPEHDAQENTSIRGPELKMEDGENKEPASIESSREGGKRDPREVTRRIDLDQLLKSSEQNDEVIKAETEELGPDNTSSGFFRSFNGVDIVSYIFSPGRRRGAHHLFILSAVLVTAFFAGKLIALWLQPASKKISTAPTLVPVHAGATGKRNKEEIKKIADTNLFRAKRSKESDEKKPTADKGKQQKKNKVCKSARRKSSLPIKMRDSVVLQDSVKSVVSVQVRNSSKQLRFRQGDRINQLAEIGFIDGDRVVLKNISNGECEYIERKGKKISRKKFNIVSAEKGKQIATAQRHEGIENVGNNYKIKKSFRDEMLKDIGTILTQARAVQIKNPDGTLSFKMVEIEPGSIYTHLNIQDGDIINSINGKKIESLNEIMNMFGKISDIENLQITLLRNGNQETLDYNFE